MDLGVWYGLYYFVTSPEFIFFWFVFSICVEVLQVFMLWWLADKISELKKGEKSENVVGKS